MWLAVNGECMDIHRTKSREARRGRVERVCFSGPITMLEDAILRFGIGGLKLELFRKVIEWVISSRSGRSYGDVRWSYCAIFIVFSELECY